MLFLVERSCGCTMDTEQCLGNTYRRYINQKMAMKLSETSFGSNVKLKLNPTKKIQSRK
jgi:hypothetical protein